MEGEKQKQASSSSSLTNELFGLKESSAAASSSSSSRLLDSIFCLPAKPLRPGVNWKSDDFATKQECADNEDKSRNSKTDMSVFYQQGTSFPCNLSSSIYYGGQDIYITPGITENTPGHATYKNNGEDNGHASKGTWWDGGVHY